MKWVDYREQLGIGFNDNQKFIMLKNNIFKMLHALKEENIYPKSSYGAYLFMVCERNTHYDHYIALETSLNNSINISEFISKYIAFCNTFPTKDRFGNTPKYTKEEILNYLLDLLGNLNISYDIIQDDDGYFIFPKGAKELDDALVSAPLNWLKDYPKAHKTYCIALRQYSEGRYIRDTADNLRKTLETFLQEFLVNNKNLETNKNEICKYLGQQDVDAGITGLFQPLINAYKSINDRTVKHNDNVEKNMLEFLLYQTGVLIRMVIVVKNSIKNSTDKESNEDAD